ncbi:MAG TPA: hypothetical protein VE010_03440 [Thermoanaerobaculia bacterium]|nr:hypothetical protein [Thermoanaerobaculia bacterium]
MKRHLFALAVLIAAARFASAGLVLEPREPRENEPFEIIFRSTSPSAAAPAMPLLRVAPGAVTIEFLRPSGGLAVPEEFGARVHVNGLPAGTYTLVVKSVEGEEFEETEFTVLPKPFSVSPTNGDESTEIVIEGIPAVDCGSFCLPLEVRFSYGGSLTVLGENVRVTPEGAIIAGVPPGGGSNMDVTVRTGDGLTHTLPRGFDYVPDLVRDEREWVMFPLNFRGRGAHGSDWRTEIIVRNDGPVTIATDPMNSDIVGPELPELAQLPAGAQAFYPEEESEGGAYLYVPRGAGKWLTYSSHIVDRSRSTTDRGTEIPVVHREDTASQIRLLNIPMSSAFRARLRVYDFDNTDRRRRLTVRVKGDDGTTIAFPLELPARFCGVIGCDERPPFVAFDLSSDPRLAKAGVVDVDVIAETNEARIWAFVSVSNNETHRVTLFTPQHKTPGGVQ